MKAGLRGGEVAYDELVSAGLLMLRRAGFSVPTDIGLIHERGPSYDCAVAEPS